MPAPTIVENGIERFVLCDLSAPSGWVRQQRRVKVWWLVGDGGEYFEGTVTAQRKAKAHRGSEDLFIEYDDGTRRWHNTQTSQIVELATEDTPEQVSHFPPSHPIDCVLTRCFVCSSSLRIPSRPKESCFESSCSI